MPNLGRKPSTHSKLSMKVHAKYPVTFTPSFLALKTFWRYRLYPYKGLSTFHCNWTGELCDKVTWTLQPFIYRGMADPPDRNKRRCFFDHRFSTFVILDYQLIYIIILYLPRNTLIQTSNSFNVYLFQKM